MTASNCKWIGLVFFLFLLGTGLTGLGVFLVREHHRGNAYADAVRIYESGDLSAAKKKFEEIVRSDANQENAYVHLAEIANREGNWREEAYCWGCAGTLNALESKYREKQKFALARERNFSSLRNLFFSSFDGNELLSDEDSFYFLLPSDADSGNPARQRYLALLREKNPRFFCTDYGKLIFCVEAAEISPSLRKELLELGKSSNPVIAFEALIRAASLEIDGGESPGKIEKHLRDAARINPYSGLFHLENFYIERLQFDRALSVCAENFRLFRRPASGIKLAELRVLSGEAEKIGEILPEFARGGKEVLIAACYLESLLAFARDRPENVTAAWKQVGDAIRTPLSALVGLYSAVHGGDVSEIESAWNSFRTIPDFHDLPQRAALLMSFAVERQISAGNTENAVRLMSLPGVDPFRSVVQARCFVIRKFQDNSLPESDISAAVKRFPADPVILQTAVEYYYRKGDFERSSEFVDKALSLNPPKNSGVRLFRILNQAALGRTGEASRLFLDAVKENAGDSGLIFVACVFESQNKRAGALEKLCTALRNAGSPHLSYAEGEFLLASGDPAGALDRFGKVEDGSPELLFRAAKILGEHDRISEAVPLYRKILKKKSAPPGLVAVSLANLAELHAASGNDGKALACAESARKLAPSNQAVLLCCLRMLRRTGNMERILSIVPAVPYEEAKDSEFRRIWVAAAESEVARLCGAGRKSDAQRLCMRLLSAEPESPVGREFLKKLNPEEESGK